MISLSIAPLTKAGFAPFGEVVETADVKPKLINEGFAERFDDLAGIDVAAEGGAGLVGEEEVAADRQPDGGTQTGAV